MLFAVSVVTNLSVHELVIWLVHDCTDVIFVRVYATGVVHVCSPPLGLPPGYPIINMMMGNWI